MARDRDATIRERIAMPAALTSLPDRLNCRAALLLFCLLTSPFAAALQPPKNPGALAIGVAQLRQAIGSWDVTTTQFAEDGSVVAKTPGTYRFEWVVPDRVVTGRSDSPEQGVSSGILFYVRERHATIEMISVGADGHPWVMTGPVDGETRVTPPTPLADGSTMQLRFTRFNVEANRFESRMEVSLDAGKTWNPGNHQVFVRAAEAPAD